MKEEQPSEKTWTFTEETEGPYLVSLAKERKIRSLFELEKGKFFRTDTVAEILDIEPEVIRELIRKKELYAIKIGKSYRIAESDLQEFLAERYTRAPEQDAEEE